MIPSGFSAHNVEVLGYHDLQGRPAFKLAMMEAGGRWYLYTGHLWHSGWTVLDVTDPTAPQWLNFVPGPPNTWTIQVQVADGRMVTALERIAPGWGGSDSREHAEGVFIWDLSEPARPRRLGHYRTGGTGTHRNFYDGGPLMHLAAGAPGYDGKIYQIVDIADPAKPRLVSTFALAEQREPARAGGAKISLHGPAYVEGSRAYLPYGDAGGVVLDIADPGRPHLVSRLAFRGLCSRQGIHTYLPLRRRKLALINDEAIAENGEENLNLAGIVDLSDEEKPRLLSLFPQPQPPADSGLKNFFEKGGRFGPHNHHHPNHQPCLEDRDDVAYLTYFNAGLRVYDIRDPRTPKEIGFFIPPDPKTRIGTKPSRLVAQVEDVLVDRRGCIYISEKNQGIYVLRLKRIWDYAGSGN
ncbi:MAG TPA: hypothetical protein VNN77_14290 [candidate division Zixibacteria bacterium]|nr:hypothetical protein [candidate division Zixibacteria bacterium]